MVEVNKRNLLQATLDSKKKLVLGVRATEIDYSLRSHYHGFP